MIDARTNRQLDEAEWGSEVSVVRGFVLVGLVVELWRLVLEDRREERDVCFSVWTGTGEHTVGRWGLRLCGCGWVILCVCVSWLSV